MRRLFWIIAPWPNAAMAAGAVAGISLALWPQQQYRIPLLIGGLIGLLSATLDAAARRQVNPALQSASNLYDVALAYRTAPIAKYRNALLLCILVPTMLLGFSSYGEFLLGILGGVIVVHFVSHAILGFWTARADGVESRAL